MNTNPFPKKSITIRSILFPLITIIIAALASVAFPDQEAIILGIAIMFVVSLQVTNHFHSQSIARHSISPMSGTANDSSALNPAAREKR